MANIPSSGPQVLKAKPIGGGRSEGDEQLRLMRWARKQSLTIPALRLLFHIPNGGARNAATAARLQLEGVKAGVPDLFLPVVRLDAGGEDCPGLWIEMKKDGGRVSIEQQQWLFDLTCEGYACHVCYGAEQARTVLVAYLGIEDDPTLLPLVW